MKGETSQSKNVQPSSSTRSERAGTPGAVPRTSRIPASGAPRSGGAVQRKEAAGVSAAAGDPHGGATSAWGPSADMDAALRGIQRKETGAAGAVEQTLAGQSPAAAESALAELPTSGGSPVDPGIAGKVEHATGQPVGDVRVHTGPASQQAAHAIQARAFTTGQDIHLSAAESPGDSRLMAHEIAHTVQQTRGAKLESGISPADHPLEAEADRVAEAVVSGGEASITAGAGGAIMRDAAADIEELLSYGAFDWAITDEEATQALSILAGLSQEELAACMASLGGTYKTRLLDNLPESLKSGETYTRILVALGAGGVQQYVQDLLSYGVFDWAVTQAEATEVLQIVAALPAAEQETLCNALNGTFQDRLRGFGSILRTTFDATPDTNVFLLCWLTATRFNLTVTATSDSSGAPWTKAGLRRCWDVLAALPASHVQDNADLSSLTRYRSGSIEGWASDDGEAAIGYGNHDLDNTNETGDFTDADDPLRGKNLFDATVRHEIGHRVDEQVGGPAYEATDAGGGWLTWDDTSNMAEIVVNASAGAISKWADAAEKAQIMTALQDIIDAQDPSTMDADLEALPFCVDHATDEDHAKKLAEIKGDKAIDAIVKAYDSPWGDPDGGVHLGDRVYQESYDWPQWVSYKHEARARKFSTYQFRAPGEWFAEAYAAYYQPPGEKGALMVGRDDATKAWFDANVDPQGGQGGTVTSDTETTTS